jgi:hypothetical protein
MLANSEFIAILRQSKIDSTEMTEKLGISKAQLRFASNAPSGMGLLKCGNVVIPFDNTVDKKSKLYELYNTNLHEKVTLQKKKQVSEKGRI